MRPAELLRDAARARPTDRASASPTSQILGHVDDDWVPLDEHPGAQEDVPGVLVVRIRDSLNFGPSLAIDAGLRDPIA